MKTRALRFEFMEKRITMDAALAAVEYLPMIVGSGSNFGADTPADRITTDYPATGSLSLVGRGSQYLCTATLIDDPASINEDEDVGNQWVLTAAHCLDTNNNGSVDFDPKKVTFYPDGDTNAGIVAEALFVHPEFIGFGRGGSVANDIALIKLSSEVPGISAHRLHESQVVIDTEFRMVGFGLAGDGINGYTTPASYSTKRVGGNIFDDAGEGVGNALNKDKIWRADFDHPTISAYSFLGNINLPYNLEANLGSGDSGGPSYIVNGGEVGGVAAINTFGYSVNNSTYGLISPPYFGSGLGGILVYPYLNWINQVMTGTGGSGDGGGGGGKGGGGRGGGGKPNYGSIMLEVSPQFSADLAANSIAVLTSRQLLKSHDVEALLSISAQDTTGSVDSREQVAPFHATTQHLNTEEDAAQQSSDLLDSAILESLDSIFSDWPLL